ncbi:hypothetical protein DAIF1_16950 [Stenotrophomonas indicatrix]|nr:hypothetical protein DAIF1_16950 [Stenotrophomonas indicatrix]
MVNPLRLTLGGWLENSVKSVNTFKCAQPKFGSKLLDKRNADSIRVSNMLTHLKVAPKNLSHVDSSQYRLRCIQKPRRFGSSVSKIEQMICSHKRFGQRSNRACSRDNFSNGKSVKQSCFQRNRSHKRGNGFTSFFLSTRLQPDFLLLSRGFRPNLMFLLLSRVPKRIFLFLCCSSQRVLLRFGRHLLPALCKKCDRECANGEEGLRPRCSRRPPAEWLAYQLKRRAINRFSDIYVNHGQSFASMGVEA